MGRTPREIRILIQALRKDGYVSQLRYRIIGIQHLTRLQTLSNGHSISQMSFNQCTTKGNRLGNIDRNKHPIKSC